MNSVHNLIPFFFKIHFYIIFLSMPIFPNDELHDLYTLPNIVRVIKSRRMRWAGHVARMEEGRGVYRVLVGRPRHGWEDNIKMYLTEIGIDGVNWIRLAQDRVQWQAFVNMVMNLQIP
jgi:hypothetical protein